MTCRSIALSVAMTALLASAANAETALDLDKYKERYPTLSSAERTAYEKALAEQLKTAQRTWAMQPSGPVGGDVCTLPEAGPVNPFTVSSTTVGATNNYDIATNCGTGQTTFGGTGASLDLAYSVRTDANCTVTATLDPTGTAWDAAIYVLQAPGAACTQLPAMADAQCVTMDDNGGSNVTETVTWNATAGTDYFVIVDGFNSAIGTFDLTITGNGCNLVPVELQSFSIE